MGALNKPANQPDSQDIYAMFIAMNRFKVAKGAEADF